MRDKDRTAHHIISLSNNRVPVFFVQDKVINVILIFSRKIMTHLQSPLIICIL